jgi:hypothetical protein
MAEDVSGRTIRFEGCARESDECGTARFSVVEAARPPRQVEVRITAQIEGILAREMGRRELTQQEREAGLSVGGRRLIEACLRERAATQCYSSLPDLPGRRGACCAKCGF